MATELFIRGKKLYIYLVFITQSYFAVLKNIRINSTQCFITKSPDKQEFQQIAFNHSSNIHYHHVKLININVLQVKKYEKLYKNKWKQLKI